MLNNAGVTHVAYILILYSIAFLLFLCKFLSLLAPAFSNIS